MVAITLTLPFSGSTSFTAPVRSVTNTWPSGVTAISMASTKLPATVSTLKYSSAGALAEAKGELKIKRTEIKFLMGVE